MNYDPEYAKNHLMLKKCRRMCNIIAIAYFISCIPFAFISLYSMILTVDNNVLPFFLDAVFKAATFIFGYLSIYSHKNLYGCYAAGIGILDIIVCGYDNFLQSFLIMVDDLNVVLLTVYIILSILTFSTNKKFIYLEQQEGFPYFNERFEDQKSAKNIDVYAERYEKIKKASSGKIDMDEL